MLYSWQVQILYCYSVIDSFDTLGIGLLPLDNEHLERLLAKVFTPLRKSVFYAKDFEN